MKVTPHKKKFGRYAVGDVFELPDRAAKLLIKVGKLAPAEEQAAVVVVPEPLQPETPAPEPEVILESNVDAAESVSDDEPQAESQEPVVETKVLSPASEPGSARRGQYERRDMAAKGDRKAPAKKAAKKVAKKATKRATKATSA